MPGSSGVDPWDWSRAAVFSTGGARWDPLPEEVTEASADFVVDADGSKGSFYCLRTAVDAAVREAMAAEPMRRRTIFVKPGFYPGPVYIPAQAPPLSIVGAGSSCVMLAAGIDAQMPGKDYARRFEPGFRWCCAPIRAQAAAIAARGRLGTGNTAVLRIDRSDTRISGMTIRNDYACDRVEAAPEGAEPDVDGRFAEGQHQAVALHVRGADRVVLNGLKLSSFQDTLYLQGDGRISLSECEIEGDVDFIFGGATAHFERSEIRARGLRGACSWSVAPSTQMERPFGFVFSDCRFTHDGAAFGAGGGSFLARQWFEGVRATPYGTPNDPGYLCRLAGHNRLNGAESTVSRATLSAVGKCLIERSEIGTHIHPDAPWDSWSGPEWSPRYRPIQRSAEDFLKHLAPWLHNQDNPPLPRDDGPPWLALRECRPAK